LRRKIIEQDDETFFILGIIYPWLRNPKEIQKILDQIEIIKREELFKEGTWEATRLAILKSQFEKISNYTSKKIAEQKSKSDINLNV
jgi:hypothetical protein